MHRSILDTNGVNLARPWSHNTSLCVGGGEVFDGCPVVYLREKADTMRHFFMAMIQKRSVLPSRLHMFLWFSLSRGLSYTQRMKRFTLGDLDLLIRPASKYGFTALRHDIVSHLKLLYPSTLDVYRSQHHKNILPKDFNGITGVNLGLECNIPAILPVAYYICSRMDQTELLSRDFEGYEEHNGHGGERTGLSPNAIRAYLAFKERMVLGLSFAVSSRVSKDLCGMCDIQSILKMCESLQFELMHSSVDYLAQAAVPAVRENQWVPCGRCKASFQRGKADLYKYVWDQLPVWSGFNDWQSATV